MIDNSAITANDISLFEDKGALFLKCRQIVYFRNTLADIKYYSMCIFLISRIWNFINIT